MIGCHMTKAPATIMYASVVLKETVRMALMVVILTVLKAKLGDTLSAQAPVQKRHGPLLVLSLVMMLVRLQ